MKEAISAKNLPISLKLFDVISFDVINKTLLFSANNNIIWIRNKEQKKEYALHVQKIK